MIKSCLYETISSFYGWESVGALLGGVGGFFSNINGNLHISGLFFGDLHHFGSSPPQCKGEKSYRDSCNSCKKIAVSGNPISNDTVQMNSLIKQHKMDRFIRGFLSLQYFVIYCLMGYGNYFQHNDIAAPKIS
jgi:hypothetical protein